MARDGRIRKSKMELRHFVRSKVARRASLLGKAVGFLSKSMKMQISLGKRGPTRHNLLKKQVSL